MAKKYKITGFARFVIVMLFIAPVAFLTASYFNGEDGFQNLKNMLGWEQEQQEQEVLQPNTTTDKEVVEVPSEDRVNQSPQTDSVTEQPAPANDNSAALQQELDATKQELKELKATNYDLRQEIKARDAEITRLKEQLQNQAPTEADSDSDNQ